MNINELILKLKQGKVMCCPYPYVKKMIKNTRYESFDSFATYLEKHYKVDCLKLCGQIVFHPPRDKDRCYCGCCPECDSDYDAVRALYFDPCHY